MKSRCGLKVPSKNSYPTPGRIAITLAFFASSHAARAFDLINIGTLPETISNYWHGFRTERVKISYLGADCTLPLTFDSNTDGRALTLMLHGITDSRDAYAPLIRHLRESGLADSGAVTMDWPKNGESDCDQVETPKQAAETIYLVFEKFRREHHFDMPRTLMGMSMGTVMAAYLSTHYPEAKIVWISPPLLREPEMSEVESFIGRIRTDEQARDFVRRVRIDHSPLPLPFISYPAMLKRIVRASPLMGRIDVPEVIKIMDSVDPQRVTMFTGQLDELTPPVLMHPSLVARFADRIHTIRCGHNINRDCYVQLTDLLKLEK